MSINRGTKETGFSVGTINSECAGRPSKEYCEKVAKKAYELFQKRGCKPGHDKEDWYEAERLVRAGRT